MSLSDCPDGEERCVCCGECYGPDGFEDGLRCKLCVEEQDADGFDEAPRAAREPLGEISAEEFQAAQRDPLVKQLLRDAKRKRDAR